MRFQFSASPALLCGALFLSFATANADTSLALYGVSYAQSLDTIDTGTGAGTVVGPIGTSFNNLVYDSSLGMLLAENVNELYTINSSTGAATALTPVTGLGSYGIVFGLTFSTSGTLYASAWNGVNDSPAKLFTINPVSGAATAVGSEGGIQIALDIAWDPITNVLYGWGAAQSAPGTLGLNTINTATGLMTPVSSTDNFTDIQALTFDANGNLYGGRESLYSIDVTTGNTTLIGPIAPSPDIRGIAFGPAVTVPEPGKAWVLGFGLVALMLARRRAG